MSEPNSSFLTEDAPSSSSSSPSTSHPQQHRRYLSVILTIVFVVSVVGNAVLIAMVVLKWKTWTPEIPPTTTRPPERQYSGIGPVCFTCNEFGPGIESNDTIYDVIRLPSKQTLCCVKQNNDVSSLFQKIISDHYTQARAGTEPQSQVSVKHPDKEPIGAHLYMTPQGAFPPSWNGTDPYNIAFCSGVECLEGNITIQEDGKYLVYSLVTVKDHHGMFIDHNLLHTIKRYNPDLPSLGSQIMLMSKTSPTFTRKPSFLSAILKLRTNDVLWANVPDTYYDFLEGGLFSNYFGVLKCK